jgi:disulfide oxidoreductase YuzD
MGYRSCVAMTVYGLPHDCDMVVDMLTLSVKDEWLREMLERQMQTHTDETANTRYVFWSFDDIKWYDDCDTVHQKLFSLVNEIEEARAEVVFDQPRLAAEFVRIGESDDDTEYNNTDHADWMLGVQRQINHPTFFKWK